MKKIIITIFLVIALLAVNQIFYLTKVQFICDKKINTGKELNAYEIFSAMQTHTNIWLFGWMIEPNTASMCFCKQFHIANPLIQFDIPEDSVTTKAKNEIKNSKKSKVHLTWKNYSSKASIYLNGSYLSYYSDETGNYYMYEINNDYKPGIINICGITLSETVFDYLEEKGILSTFISYRFEKIVYPPMETV